MVEFVTLKFYF